MKRVYVKSRATPTEASNGGEGVLPYVVKIPLLKDKHTPDLPKGIALFKLELQLVTELTWVHGM